MAIGGSKGIVSSHFPYVQILLHLKVDETTQQEADLEALLDTGFDGDVVVPANLTSSGTPPVAFLTWMLAAGTEVVAAAFLGEARVGGMDPVEVVVTVLGDEALIGRNLIRHFRVVLDHGQQLIVEP